jgi:hypothetical protein
MRRLSDDYEREYAALLARIAAGVDLGSADLTMFWPKVGSRYDGDLMVIGRAVNGWIDRWSPGERPDPARLAATARLTAEGDGSVDQVGWVLDSWGRGRGRYSTSRSQFWKTVRLVAIHGHPERDQDWPSHVAWTNLAKVAPWAGGNPAGSILELQRQEAVRLLAREAQELQPRRVVAFTGRWWFETFAADLGLDIRWRDGLVEGVGVDRGRTWVVAVHPMTRSPGAVADEVIKAFG